MPQKRNPDGAELLRAKAARVLGALLRLLELQRGLPIGYHKDLQEDKPALFEAEDDAVRDARGGHGHAARPALRPRGACARRSTIRPGYLLGDRGGRLARAARRVLREAHHAVGQLVRTAEERGVALEALPLEDFRAAHRAFDKTVYRALTPEAAVAARKAVGGTAPANVAREVRRWERALAGR
jgi:argininosuccinate lyase